MRLAKWQLREDILGEDGDGGYFGRGAGGIDICFGKVEME